VHQVEEFLSKTFTGDETWVHHYEPESKRQSVEWKHPGSPTKNKFKVKVKISLLQAVEAHRVRRGQGSHIT
jgi:hypothetical protein